MLVAQNKAYDKAENEADEDMYAEFEKFQCESGFGTAMLPLRDPRPFLKSQYGPFVVQECHSVLTPTEKNPFNRINMNTEIGKMHDDFGNFDPSVHPTWPKLDPVNLYRLFVLIWNTVRAITDRPEMQMLFEMQNNSDAMLFPEDSDYMIDYRKTDGSTIHARELIQIIESYGLNTMEISNRFENENGSEYDVHVRVIFGVIPLPRSLNAGKQLRAALLDPTDQTTIINRLMSTSHTATKRHFLWPMTTYIRGKKSVGDTPSAYQCDYPASFREQNGRVAIGYGGRSPP